MVRRIWPAVVLSGEADAAVLSRAVRRGTLVRLGRGVYSGLTDDDPEQTVRAHWTQIVAGLFPGAVVVGAAAAELAGRPPEPLPRAVDVLTVRHPRRAVLRLAGLEVRSAPGPDTTPGHALPHGLAVEATGARPGPPPSSTGPAPATPPTAPVPTSRPAQDVTEVVDLSESAQLVGLALVRAGAATRPQLGTRLGLSKPTVSLAVAELVRAGLVSARSERIGTAGRAASLYGVARSAGWTLGIDLGNAQIRLAAQSLGGASLGERRTTLQETGSVERLVGAAATAVTDLTARLGDAGPLSAVAIALPKPVRADHRLTGREGPSLGGLAAEEVLSRLALPAGVPVLAENNVNCSVLAEMAHGVAQGREDVVFVQVGERVGAGIVVGGRLVHGARGGAGEIADFPFPWTGETEPVELGLERHLGAAAFVDRATPPGPQDGPTDLRARLDALLGRAEAGEEAAATALRDHAHEVAQLVTALVAVLDPDIVVLGGSVGEHPLVARWVRSHVARTFPHTEVVPSALRGASTVDGAATLAAQSYLGRLFPLALGRPRGRTAV